VFTSVDGRRLPLALTVRVAEAAVALRRTRRAVPAIDTDVRRPVTQVVAQTTVAVRRTRLPETHAVRQPLPRVPAGPHTTFNKLHQRQVG